MNRPVVVIGIGEIGSVLARGFLRSGYPVYPVTRDMDVQTAANEISQPALVVVAVGETALPDVLAAMPEQWRDKLALIQNELLPRDWEKYNDTHPTVASVWFEKKQGQDVKVVVPSPIYGSQSDLLSQAFAAMNIPFDIVTNDNAMLSELVRKNYYILTSNIAGLESGGSVSTLWAEHRELAENVLKDVHSIQSYLTGQRLDHEALTQAMLRAFEGDPEHQCMGRSAPQRLQRAIEIAQSGGIEVPELDRIAAKHL